MSVWTHVAGIIRIDGISSSIPSKLPLSLGEMTPEFELEEDTKTQEEMEIYFQQREAQWQKADASGIPMGSEGSLRWEWISNKDESSINRGYYTIYGDLRDFTDPEIILKWVQKITKELSIKNYWIRQISINVWVEGEPPIFIGSDPDQEATDEAVVMFRSTKNANLLYATK